MFDTFRRGGFHRPLGRGDSVEGAGGGEFSNVVVIIIRDIIAN